MRLSPAVFVCVPEGGAPVMLQAEKLSASSHKGAACLISGNWRAAGQSGRHK